MGIPASLSQVPDVTPYIQYIATAGQTIFPYPFPITQDSDLVVVVNGSTQATDSGYSLSGVGSATGGNVVFTAGRASNDVITLYRDIPIERISQIAQNSGFSSTTFNNEFNNFYLIAQQLAQSVTQCLQFPLTNSPAPSTTITAAQYAGKYLSFDSNGNPIPAVLTSSGSLTRAIIAGLLGYLQDNVLLHGADDTGVADSLAAFNAATAANADYVYVPPGTYKLSGNTNAGLWELASGVTFTGAGNLLGSTVANFGAKFIQQLVSNNDTTSGQRIGLNVEQGFYQTGTNSQDQFGTAIETWTPSTSTTVWSAQLTGSYGSFSHFGSGSLSDGYGGSFEGFNSGSATATLIVGVNGNAWNGGVTAGVPAQTATNNGVATNLRGVQGFASNGSSGTVTNAASLYANAVTKTSSGGITNVFGLDISDQTAGANNYALRTGIGLAKFGDCIQIAGSTNLPAATSGQFFAAGGFGGVSNGRLYVGDNSGFRLEFAYRTGSADAVIGYITDAGQAVFTGGCVSSGSPNGYATGAGGAVVQATSKTTAVTLNKSCGTITMNNAALNAGTTATFVFNNSKITANTIVVFSLQNGASTASYIVTAESLQAGVCAVSVYNHSASNLSEAIILNFALIQTVTS